MPRVERSAGFIVFRSVPEAAGGREYLLLDYGRHWDYAKGHVEAGEDELTAALRELREETGLPRPEVIAGFEREIEYYFRSSRHGLIQKHVTFFLGRTTVSDVVLSEEHVGSVFLNYEAARAKLTYATARDVLSAAEAFLTTAGRSS
jgi:bis(5'-nucleosidyl)-tetraphosphatase